jgi:Tfp pilus assembly protein PilF
MTDCRAVIALALVATLLAACAEGPLTFGSPAADPPGLTATRDVDPKDVPATLAMEGLKRLEAGDLDAASESLQAAIKLRPDVMGYHLLLGTIYHLKYLAGRNTAELAMTAYEVAARLDDRSPLPFQQIGRLNFQTRRYEASRDAFLKAYARQPGRAELLDELLAAAWYAGDLAIARSVREDAGGRGLESATMLRLDALLAGVLQDPTTARPAFAALERRYGYERVQLAQLEQRVGALQDSAAGLPADPAGPAETTPGTGEPDPSVAVEPAGHWFACDPEPGIALPTMSEMQGIPNASGDETERLPAIPRPCPGAPAPPAVMLDTAIIQSNEAIGSRYGVNLLNALSVFATGGLSFTETTATANGSSSVTNSTNVRSFRIDLGSSPTTNYIAYALDIANSVQSTSEIISQPALVAIDRLPSTFFSGSIVTIGVAGSDSSSSTITDRPIGVSLSITPTVIDDETLNLNVKVARSSLATSALGAASTFSQTLSTTRTSVAASVTARYGQTILVSGLTEAGSTSTDDGTPVLKDIPVVQWLFDRQSDLRYRSSVLVAITPRRLGDVAPARLTDAMRDPHVQNRLRRVLDRMTERSSIQLALKRMSGRRFFDLTEDGDFASDDWYRDGRLKRLFEDLARTLYR